MRSSRLAFCCTFALLACQNHVVPSPPPPAPTSPGGQAALKVDAALSGTRATLGQNLTLTLSVTNTGKSPALGVSVSPLAQSGTGRLRVEGAQGDGTIDLQPGEQHAYALSLTAADPGELILSGEVDAMDGPTGAAISATLAPLELSLQSPASLSVASSHAPRATDVSQDTQVTVTVSNDGEAEAQMVAVQLVAAPGSVPFELRSGPLPVVAKLKSGDTQTFTFSVRPGVSGNLVLMAHAFGLDGNDMSAVRSDDVVLPSIGVETPAKLVAQMQLPDVMTTGQTFEATLVVRNDGEALAKAVLPVPWVPLATTLSGNGSATAASGPVGIDLPGGATATFTWSYVAQGTGTFSLAARIHGTDLNSSAAVEAVSPATTAQVLPPSVLQVTDFVAPSIINPTQPFDVTLKVKNIGGTAANGVLPDPLPPALLPTAGALARPTATPAAQNIAPGATATFVFHYLENGTSLGSLKLQAGARGIDAVSGLPLAAVATQTNVVSVLAPPSLVIEAVTPPLKVTRGQHFPVEVRVHNVGGTAATNVAPVVTLLPTANALGTAASVPGQTIAGGDRGIFTVDCTESGTGSGSLRARASGAGMNPNFGNTLGAAPMLAPLPATQVQEPPSLQVVTFMLPGSLNRGATFALGMVVTNTGEADAHAVTPTNPLITAAMLARASLLVGAMSLTVPGGKSRTFTWQYQENGTGVGTLLFHAGASGTDANDGVAVSADAVDSNLSSVDAYQGCNGSQVYPSLDGHLLDRDRLDLQAGDDRLRVKPYDALVGDFQRLLLSQPAVIKGQYATFDAYAYAATNPPRWYQEQQLSAISLYRAFLSAYQACLTLTSTDPKYQAAPDPQNQATALQECRSWQTRFWSATPSTAQTQACADYAVSADNDSTQPREKWAATCATVAASTGFLAE
jgi:uncharacterized repeat protein (TIGR01451 family)